MDRGHQLNKLKLSGFSSQVLDWFNSYLSNRTQIVISNSELSLTRPVSIGVPQGTILGPILFLVYVNDLPKNLLNSKLVMYADDTTIICHSHDENTVVTKINLALHAADKWFCENGLILNISKSSLLTVGTMQRLKHFSYTPVVLNGSPINYVDEFKLLGIYIDKYLTFDKHISYLVKRISPKIGILHRLRHTLDTKSLLTIYIAIMQSIFDYCISVWGHCSVHNINKLQRLQARAVTGNFNYDYSSSCIIKDLNLMNIHERYNYLCSHVQMFK